MELLHVMHRRGVDFRITGRGDIHQEDAVRIRELEGQSVLIGGGDGDQLATGLQPGRLIGHIFVIADQSVK